MIEQNFPLPPFNKKKAMEKIQSAEDVWNTKNPEKVIKAYSIDSEWRNRDLFIKGRGEILQFLKLKWEKEKAYKLKKEYWAHTENRIAVRFEYEFHDQSGQWWRAYGNENWEFDENGFMKKRYASINDVKINREEKRL